MSWAYRGTIQASTVTKVVLSPDFANDGTVFVATLAGLSISRDGGSTWEYPMRGAIGPLIHDLVVSPSFAQDDTLFVASPTGVFRSTDAGCSWMRIQTPAMVGGMLVQADAVLLASAMDKALWRLARSNSDDASAVVGEIPHVPLTLASDQSGRVMWSLSETDVFESRGDGGSWQPVHVPTQDVLNAVAPCGPDGLAVAAEGALLMRHPNAKWTRAQALNGLNVTSVQASKDGMIIVAGAESGVYVSRDGGLGWRQARAGSALTVAASADGMWLFAGFDGEGCARSTDGGESWQTLEHLRGTLVSELRADDKRVVARTLDGHALTLQDDGSAWLERDHRTGVRAVAYNPQAKTFAFLTASDISDAQQSLTRLPSTLEPLHFAVSGTAMSAAVADADSVWTWCDDQKHWTRQTPPLAEGETICDIAFGRISEQGEIILAVATGNLVDSTVWVHHESLKSWHRVITSRDHATGIALTCATGSERIFATSGNSVFRPARFGHLLFAEAPISPVSPQRQTLQLAVATQAEDDLICVLTTDGLLVSHDSGATWSATIGPEGPPITAIALRTTHTSHELVAAQLGGSVYALPLVIPSD